MAKLTILSEPQKGRSHELKADDTVTIGRVEDNAFQIAESSVSSHHCEVILRADGGLVVKDLNSTNGTFINGQQITGESALKPGQTLRVGQVELRLEDNGAPATAEPVVPAVAPEDKLTKKAPKPMGITQGVKLEQGHAAPAYGQAGFAKKSNTGTKIFIIAAIVVGIIVVAIIFYVIHKSGEVGGQ